MDPELLGQQTQTPETPPATTPTTPTTPEGTQGSTVSSADLYAQQQAAAAAATTGQAAANLTAAANLATPPATPPAPAAQGTAAQPQQWSNAREYARSLGFDPGQATDDATFLQGLMAQAQRAQLYQQQLQGLAASQAAMLQRQPAPAAPAAPAAPKPGWWNPPEFNPAWEQLVTQDAQGNYGVKPGAPPDILPRYLAYQQYRRDFADRLLRDPSATLQPMVEEVASKRAQAIVQEHLGQMQERNFTDNFLASNSGWLYQRDVAGNPMTNPMTGQPQLSAAGQRFQGYVAQAEQMGIRGSQQQANIAKQLLQRDVLQEQAQQWQAAQQGQQQNQTLIQQGNRTPSHQGTIPPVLPNAQPPAQNPGLSLKDQLTQALAAQGISDAQIAGDARL